MKNLFIAIILFASLGLHAEEQLRVRVYADKTITQVSFHHLFGRYQIVLDSALSLPLNRSDNFKFTIKSNKVMVECNDSVWGRFSKVKIVSHDLKSFFYLAPENKNIAPRKYDDNLEITSNGKELLLINEVSMENYLAGVVQSETWGATKDPYFFRIQAIISRNYALSNITKHKKEGCNLCDGVHCQAYYGRANQPEVLEGAFHSRGEIIVDSSGNIIEALFFSNSGGETVSAENVWGKAIPYLKAVQDTFSLSGKAAKWEKYIPMNEWLQFFRSKGIASRKKEIKEQLLNFAQDSGRKTHIMNIPLTDVRKHFQLRSTYFSAQPWGGEVKLSGKGYGHGVGLSQEGAIQMSSEGYDYYEIIEYYYTGVRVTKIDQDAVIAESEKSAYQKNNLALPHEEINTDNKENTQTKE